MMNHSNLATIQKRKNIIHDNTFLDSAHQVNEGRMVVYDYAIDNFVDKLAPNIKEVVDRNYDTFVMKTKEVAVEIKKLQRQIKWEQEVFDQIEEDLDNQPVLQDLHKEIRKYNDIYRYYQQYLDQIKNHISVEEKKLNFLREQYKQLRGISQQQTTKKMTGLVKYFRERLSLFQFSTTKNSSSRSPSRRNESNSKQTSPDRRIREEFLNEDLNSKQFQENSLPQYRRKRLSSLAVSNDQEMLLSDRSHYNSQFQNDKNMSLVQSSVDKKLSSMQKEKPRMVFSMKSKDPRTSAQFRTTQTNLSNRITQQNGFYPSISSQIKQDYSVLSESQQIKMISHTSPLNIMNSSLYQKQRVSNNNNQSISYYPSISKQNNSILLVKNESNTYPLRGNSIDFESQQILNNNESKSKNNSYLFMPQRRQKSPGQRLPSDKFRSTQASPNSSFKETSLFSQNSLSYSIADNIVHKQQINESNSSDSSSIMKNSYQQERSNLKSNQQNRNINFSLQHDSRNDRNENKVKPNFKILEFDNTLQQFPVLYESSKDQQTDKNKLNLTQNNNQPKTARNQLYQQEMLNQQEEQSRLQLELKKIQKDILDEKQKSQNIRNNILSKIKNLNKLDSMLNESFKAVQKFVEKKIDSQEFNEQFCTQQFLDVLDILEQEKKPRTGVFSQQRKFREKKQDFNLILSEEDLEKISERDELYDYESQKRLSIQYESGMLNKAEQIDQIMQENNEAKVFRSSTLSIKSIMEVKSSMQELGITSSQFYDNSSSQRLTPRESIFNKLHFFDFQQLKSYQLFFLLVKDESLMGKFFLQNFLKRKRALQIFAQSKQY